MPSPTLMTRPTSAVTTPASKSFRRRLMTSLISLELMANSVCSPIHSKLCADPGLHARQPAPQLLQPRRYARVDHPVADAEHEAADYAAVDPAVQPDLPAQPARQALLQPAPLAPAPPNAAPTHRAPPAPT